MSSAAIPALLPHGPGHQFVVYGDACSGVPGTPHERSFAEVNAVIRRLTPSPEFIVFTGDEIRGLAADPDELRRQWRHWLDHEMAWLDRRTTPLWHVTGNHTAYDPPSEAIFREMLDLPRNGPPGQEGLSYWTRRGDLLLVFVHTLWSGLGGEGHVETTWLDAVLHQHADARTKLVVGHHPVFPVNGFAGAYERDVGPEHAGTFWEVLVSHNVLAYLCSHILAFDVQVHRGVLQVCTAGAGTLHRMPEKFEYLHCTQVAIDGAGLRCQVLDTTGATREAFHWPPTTDAALSFRITGCSAAQAGPAQTLTSAFDPDVQSPFWIGLCGPNQILCAIVGPEPGRSPHTWHGPAIPADRLFEIRLLFDRAMGPGGLLYQFNDETSWSSLCSASPWGMERLCLPSQWSIGHGQYGPHDRPFLGNDLVISITVPEGGHVVART
jgi:hypothetical protein